MDEANRKEILAEALCAFETDGGTLGDLMWVVGGYLEHAEVAMHDMGPCTVASATLLSVARVLLTRRAASEHMTPFVAAAMVGALSDMVDGDETADNLAAKARDVMQTHVLACEKVGKEPPRITDIYAAGNAIADAWRAAT